MVMTDKEIKDTIDEAIIGFKGNSGELELAIGALMLSRHLGWKPLFLMHDRRTIVKFEKILKINFRDAVREEGPLAFKSVAWEAFQGCTNFWKAVTGAITGIRDSGLKKI